MYPNVITSETSRAQLVFPLNVSNYILLTQKNKGNSLSLSRTTTDMTFEQHINLFCHDLFSRLMNKEKVVSSYSRNGIRFYFAYKEK